MMSFQAVAGVAALVQVVDNGAPTHAGFGDFVRAGIAIDEGIGGVARTLERDRQLRVVDAEIAERGFDAVRLAQLLHHFEFGDLVPAAGRSQAAASCPCTGRSSAGS